MLHRKSGLRSIPLAGALAWAWINPANANPYTIVNYQGRNIRVSYQEINVSTSEGSLRIQNQPWWGNSSSALNIAQQLYSKGFAPGANVWSGGVPNPGGIKYSPWIAYSQGNLAAPRYNQVGFAVYSQQDLVIGSGYNCPQGLCNVNFTYPWYFLVQVQYPSSTAQPYASIQSVSIDALKNQREMLLAQAGECDQNGWVVYDSEKVKGKPKPKKYQSLCVFGEGGYAQGDINGTGTIGGYSTSNATTAYGIEWKPSKKWAIGAAYGYGTANLGNFSFQDTSAYINSDINSGNIYGVYRPGKNWKISALAGYSKFNSNGARTFLGDTANSTFSSNGYTGALEASYDIFLGTDLNNKKNKSSPARFKPLVGIAWGGNQQAGFSEKGNGTLLNVQEQMSNSLVATFGASLEAPIPLNKKKTTVPKPRFGIAYQYDFLANQDANKQITASLQDDSTTSFTEVGQNRGINNIYLNLGGDLQVNPSTVVYANVNYQAFSYGNQIGYQGGIRIKL